MSKKTAIVIISVIIAVAVSALAVLLGMGTAYKYSYSFGDDKVSEIELTSCEQITSLTGVFNDRLTMSNDIVIDKPVSLTNIDRPFDGVFDGNGYSLIFRSGAEKPFIGYIGKKGIVKNLKIIIEDFSVDVGSFAYLAFENNGTIKDCNVLGTLSIENAGAYSLLTVVNNGNIVNTIINGVDVQRKNGEASVVFGGMCAYNYGRIENCVSYLHFKGFEETDEKAIYVDGLTNNGIGSSCGVNEHTMTNVDVVLDKGVYTSDRFELGVNVITDASIGFSEENIFIKLGFSQDLWKFVDNEIVLIGGAA